MKRPPPPKQAGRATGPRRINGLLMDVASLARKYGLSEKKVRSDVARGLLPHRQSCIGGRILFLEDEIIDFYRRLPGVTASEALANIAVRTQTPALRKVES
ncbi:helix-turn-helix domain-containing protein [Nitrospiraceae bacterium AH_259_D15_M11_P09]|nr:helix-turn-helix domain-containing protein [Nitrospiraceae bacterium AH_259_D15_M11_P09]